MRINTWVGWTAAALLLSGCSETARLSEKIKAPAASPEAEAAATAGGEVSEATEGAIAAEPNAALATQYLGNAFVSAARAHNSAVQGNTRAVRNEVWAIRRQLRLASQWATIDQQREINRLEGQVIELEARLADETSDPQAQSATLMREFLTTYDTIAGEQGGGAGTAPAPEQVPQEPTASDGVPADQVPAPILQNPGGPQQPVRP